MSLCSMATTVFRQLLRPSAPPLMAMLLVCTASAQTGSTLMISRGMSIPSMGGAALFDNRYYLQSSDIRLVLSTPWDPARPVYSTPYGIVGVYGSLPTAAAGGSRVWYVGEYNSLLDRAQLYMCSGSAGIPESQGTIVYQVNGYRIDALAIGSFRGSNGTKLIVGLNGTRGQGCSVWSFDAYSTSPAWTLLYGFDTGRRIDALAAGRFDDPQYDRLVYGFHSTDGKVAEIFASDFEFDRTVSPIARMYARNARVNALAAGDFGGVGHADLVAALQFLGDAGNATGVWRHDRATARRYRAYFSEESSPTGVGLVRSMASGRFISSQSDTLMLGAVDRTGAARVVYAGNLTSAMLRPLGLFPAGAESSIHLAAFNN
jgi:hypothetical protein